MLPAAVVVGLAAQQTLGDLIAGMVLIAARPFRVGDRVRLQAGAEVVVRIQATPVEAAQGPALADEVLAALAQITSEDEDTADTADTAEREPAAARSSASAAAGYVR